MRNWMTRLSPREAKSEKPPMNRAAATDAMCPQRFRLERILVPARRSVLRPSLSERVAFSAPSPDIFAGQVCGTPMLN